MSEPNASDGDGPKLHVDSDWKAQAQAEKQRLGEKVKTTEQSGGSAKPGGAAAGGIPKATFESLINNLASQALLFLGAIPDPRTGQRIQHLDLARHHIDTLGVIQEKTLGNLSDQEAELLNSTLYELRQAYIQITTAARNE